jgi:hypothetical protein
LRSLTGELARHLDGVDHKPAQYPVRIDSLDTEIRRQTYAPPRRPLSQVLVEQTERFLLMWRQFSDQLSDIRRNSPLASAIGLTQGTDIPARVPLSDATDAIFALYRESPEERDSIETNSSGA